MHYRRIDPQPPEFTQSFNPEMVKDYVNNIPGGCPEDMPNAETVIVGGEWYWREVTAKG